MAGLLKRFIAVFFRRVIGRYYAWICAASLLVSALAGWVIATQWNINSDFKALLPRNSAAYQAMQEVGDRVGSGSALFVVIDSPDGQANKAFAKRYAAKLRELPEVALAHYHNDKTFFEKNELLYLDRADLVTMHDRLADKIKDAKRKANPLFVSLDSTSDKDSEDELVDRERLSKKYGDLAQNDYKEYLVSEDGYSLTIIVRFVESSTDLAETNMLLDKVKKLGQRLEPTTYNPEMNLEYGGGLINREEEYNSILDDIQTSALFTIIGLFLVIALYFRRVRAVAFVLVPLLMGVVWTLAIAFLIFGELTTVAAFIFAILLGLSIDFSIHLLNGYDHARRAGREPVDALISCYETTGKATVMGAVSTFVTFVVLSFAQFRGLSQFGQVASLGVVCALLAMLIVLPSLVLLVHRLLPHEPDRKTTFLVGWTRPDWMRESNLKRFAPHLLVLALALTALAAAQAPALKFQENFRKIGDVHWPWDTPDLKADSAAKSARRAKKAGRRLAKAVDDTAIQVRKRLDPDTFTPRRQQMSTGDKWTSAVGNAQSSTPTVLLFDDAKQAQKVFEYIRDQKRTGKLDTVRSMGSIYAFMPGTAQEQAERMTAIVGIRQMLDDEDLSVLNKHQRERLDKLRGKLDVEPFSPSELPLWTKRLFKEAGPRAKSPRAGEPYAYEYVIYVNSAIDSMVGLQARRFLGQIQQVREQTGVEFRIGSQSYIYTAMLDEIKTDGAVMLGIALVIVFMLLVLTFGHPLRGLVALSPLVVGAVWMFGLAASIGLGLDFFNVVIVPVIVGMGVDDGIHFYYHYRREGPGSVGSVTNQVGAAVVMTSVTSMIGFGGLALTDYDGLRSMGLLAVLGIGATLIATLLVLPAMLWMGERLDIKWLVGSR